MLLQLSSSVQSIRCRHKGIRHKGTLALRAERQSTRMSEIENGTLCLYGIVQQFEELGFKGLKRTEVVLVAVTERFA